jgi:preprotein translocase subunit SecD
VPLTDVVSAGDRHTLQPAPAIIELLLGQSALARPSCERPLLDFRVVRLDDEGRPVSDAAGRPEWEPAVAMGEDGQQHHLSSAHFRPTVFVTEDGAGLPAVVFEFTDEGSALFAEITARLSDRSLPLGIFVEDELVAAPVVRSAIRDRGIISGLSVDEAQRLADRLNADAMRCPGDPHQPR